MVDGMVDGMSNVNANNNAAAMILGDDREQLSPTPNNNPNPLTARAFPS
jgi:hypothetical protein